MQLIWVCWRLASLHLNDSMKNICFYSIYDYFVNVLETGDKVKFRWEMSIQHNDS